MRNILILCGLLFTCNYAHSQITGHIFANNQVKDTVIICAGQPLILALAGSVLIDDFNNGYLSPLWSSNASPMFNNPCTAYTGQNDGTTCCWIGPATSFPRELVTIPINVGPLTQICFDMVYSSQANASPCEGPDEPTEGVHLQWSDDMGITWNDIHYWDPVGGYDSVLTTWHNYCLPCPVTGTNIKFRWFQSNTSGNDYDHWGIDNVYIGDTSLNCSVVWSEEGIPFASSYILPPIHPDSSTTYYAEFFCGTDTMIDSIRVEIDTTCLVISGYVYKDINSNCIMDAGELAVPMVPVQFFIDSSYTEVQWTDWNGYYQFTTSDTGTFMINAGQVPYPCLSVACPSSGYYITDSSGQHLDFGLQLAPGFDLAVWGHTTGFIPGANGVMTADLDNLCGLQSGQLIIYSNNPEISVTGFSISPDQVIGDSMIWNFINTADLAQLHISYYTDPYAVLGDTICIDFSVTPIAGDLNVFNNNDTYCREVATSYDPNNKEVFPLGNGQEGYISANIPLTYTINFQNTGTAMAQNVVVVDTLDEDLQPLSVAILGYSHEVNVSLYGSILEFIFPDIMLPDSGSDFNASHGYIRYSVSQDPNLASLTKITNTAYIFFDYNEPVITNTALNTIKDMYTSVVIQETDNGVKLYPNPANDFLNIISSYPFKLEVCDINGRIKIKNDNCHKQSLLDISKLSQGVYFIRINNQAGLSTVKLVKL